MIGLICYRIVGTVTTKWDLRTNKTLTVSRNGYCVSLSSSPSPSPVGKDQIKVKEEASNFEGGNDREKFRLVVERMANEIRVESFFCVRWRPKLAGSVVTTRFRWKTEGSFQMLLGFWGR